MKGILEFNLPEDKIPFDHAVRGLEYYILLSDLDNKIRSYLKYTENRSNPDEFLISLREDIGNLLRDEY